MKELFILSTKNVHFTFYYAVKVQNDGVIIVSPLGPVLSDIFITELETSLLPELTDYNTVLRHKGAIISSYFL